MSINLNVRAYNNKDLLLFPASIGDYVPNDHLSHVVDEAVEEIHLIPYYQKIPSVGNPSYHPALMIKIWFYGYATGTTTLLPLTLISDGVRHSVSSSYGVVGPLPSGERR